ncbi:MAG: ECF-type sigma factor, partial [Planctomycetota bacterium]
LIDHARARNARPDRVRRVDADAVKPAADTEPSPAAQAELGDVASVVAAMAQVSPRAAKALQLRYWDHQSVKEAAASLKISPALLKAEVQWAKQFIRERLGAVM